MRGSSGLLPAALALGLGALPACGGGGGDSAAPTQVWAVVGSSTAAGAGATPGDGWTALLAADEKQQGVDVHDLAQRGLTSYQVLPSGTAVPPNRPPPDPQADVTAALALHPRLLVLRAGLSGPDGHIAPVYDSGDGVHLNDAGHRWVWQQVRAVLQAGTCFKP